MKLQLLYPLKDVVFTQQFGQNNLSLYNQLGMLGHNGIDMRAPDGTLVLASHNGRVTYAGYDGSGGLTIVIRTEEQYDYKDGQSFFKTIYCHLKKDTLLVTGGQTVKAGQVIAQADNTGASTGSHLHFGLKPIYKNEEDWTWFNADQNNGYFGAIDPQPYFVTKYSPFQKIIKIGDISEDVVLLQAFLVRKGLLKMPPNVQFGTYARLTAEAVMKYQISKGIKHNKGVQVGPLTLEALNIDYSI